MNKNLLFASAAVLLAAGTILLPDGWIYAGTALMALVIVAAIRLFHTGTIKLTRWAKGNPRKTQVLITVLQVFILSLGLLAGYNLKQLGYQVSGTPLLIFGVILVSGFFITRFLPKRNLIALPAALNKDRLAYMSIALSAWVVMIITGNRIEDKFPGSFLSTTLQKVDGAIFPGASRAGEATDLTSVLHDGGRVAGDPSSSFAFASLAVTPEKGPASVDPGKEERELKKAERKAEKLEKKKERLKKRLEKWRKAFAAISTVATVLLVILLIITSCAGICLILIGGSAGSVILGIILTAGSIWGFVELFKKRDSPTPKSST